MAKRRSKKFKMTRDVFITILVLVLIVAIAFTAIYFVDRDLFNQIIGAVTPPVEDTPGGNGPGGDKPSTEILGDKVEIHFLDVGQGDSIFIMFPDGKTMMIDAGTVYLQDNHPYKDKGGIKKKLFDTLDGLNVKTIDAFLLTHSDADHCSYMDDIIAKYDVKNIFVPDLTYNDIPDKDNPPGNINSGVFRKAMEAAYSETYLDENGNKVNANVVKNLGDVENLKGEGYTVKSYCRDKEYYSNVHDAKTKNGVSPLTFLEFGGRTVLFAGDAEGDKSPTENNVEPWFIAKGIKVDIDVLKVGHHGSAASTTDDFLDYIDPEYAVISSCGVHKTFRHPRPEPLNRLKNYRDVTPDDDYNGIAQLYRTDKHGDIVLTIGANGGMNFVTEHEATDEELYTPAPQATSAKVIYDECYLMAA